MTAEKQQCQYTGYGVHHIEGGQLTLFYPSGDHYRFCDSDCLGRWLDRQRAEWEEMCRMLTDAQ